MSMTPQAKKEFAMGTLTQRNICLGQDINNAWALFIAQFNKSDTVLDVEAEFEICFKTVRLLSEAKRAEERLRWVE